MKRTAYQVLGVVPSESYEEIKRAFRKLSADYHPDKGGDTIVYSEILSAYDKIRDKKSRAKYDSELKLTHNICYKCGGKGRIDEILTWGKRVLVLCPLCYGNGYFERKSK